LRIAYAQHAVDSDFSDEDRTIFVDEKRFEANSPGIYNLPIEDSTPAAINIWELKIVSTSEHDIFLNFWNKCRMSQVPVLSAIHASVK
jgi:hypothetical protein